MTNQPGQIDTPSDLLVVRNRATTVLTSGITDASPGVGGDLPVGSSALFPDDGVFIVSIDDELILCDDVGTGTIRVLERGAYGSSAAAHSTGAQVAGNMTAQHYETLRGAIIGTQNAARRFPHLSAADSMVRVGPRPDPFEMVRRFAL